MAEFKVEGIPALNRLLRQHAKAREKRVRKSLGATARSTEKYIDATTIPVAFGELRKSGHVTTNIATGAKLVYDAPHAAAVENGSRPHWVPLEPLIAWVKLRGMQALHKRRQRQGSTTKSAAAAVGAALKSRVSDGALDIDAPEQVAKAIQLAIAKRGTKPHWFARQALPAARAFLAEQIAKALPDP